MLVILGNAHVTSGGTGPGMVDMLEDEGRALIGQGYAVRLAEEPVTQLATEPAKPTAKKAEPSNGKKRA